MPPAISGLTIREEVGRGAASVVYRAEREGQSYAVKLHARASNENGAEQARRFYREASVLAALRHPALESIFEVGESDGFLYLVKELVDGGTLAQRLVRGPLPEAMIVHVGTQLAGALAEVHRRGLVHRDVKPDNVLLGSGDSVKLVDLGFAAVVGEGDESVTGTLLYGAPEQTGMLKRPVDGRSDLYSLGVLMFECAAGFPPFRSEDPSELLRLHAVRKPPSLAELRPELSHVLCAIIEKLLAKDPDDRYQSAVSLIADFDAIEALKASVTPALGLTIDADAARHALVGNAQVVLSSLKELWRERIGEVVLVSGPPGHGKTHVLNALEAHVREGQRLALHLYGEPNSLPFAPLKAALDQIAASLESMPSDTRELWSRRLRSAAGSDCGWLHGLSPRLLEGIGARDVPAVNLNHEQFYDQTVAFLVALSHADGLLVVVDEIEAIDASTRQVLRRAAEAVHGSRILLVVTAAHAELRDAETAEMLRAARGFELLALSRDDVAALLADLLHGEVPEDLLDEVVARCDCSPLAVRELVRGMLDAGVLHPRWGTWQIDRLRLDRLELPRDMITFALRRAAELDERTREILAVAALLGTRLRTDWIALAAACEPADVEAAMLQGEQRGLLVRRRGQRPQFLDERVRAELERPLWPEERTAAHLRIANALEAGGGGDAEIVYRLAEHLYLGASATDPARVMRALDTAGQLALRTHAVYEAISFLERSIRLAEQHALTFELSARQALGEAYVVVGRFEDAEQQFLRAAEQAAPGLARGVVYLSLGRVYLGSINVPHATSALLRALGELGAPLPRSNVWQLVTMLWVWLMGLFVGLTGLGAGKVEGAERKRLEALVTCYDLLGLATFFDSQTFLMVQMALRPLWPARRLGAGPELARCYANYACFLAMLKASSYRRYADEAVELARATHDPELYAHCCLWRSVATNLYGRIVESDNATREVVEQLGHHMSAEDYMNGTSQPAWNCLIRGRFREARMWGDISAGRAKRSRGAAGHLHMSYAYAAGASGFLGSAAEGHAMLAEMHADFDDGNRVRNAEACSQSVLLALSSGNFDGVDEIFARHATIGLHPMTAAFYNRDFYAYRCHVLRECCARAERAGDPVGLAQLEEARGALRLTAAVPVLKAHLYVVEATCARLRGRERRALKQLERAQRLGAELEAPWILLEVELERARLLRAQGLRWAAMQAAQSARNIAIDIGWVSRVRDIRDEFGLEDHRAALPASTVAQPEHGSTPKGANAEVARLKRQLEALLDLALASSTVLDPDAQARVALDQIVRIIGAERAFLFMFRGDGEVLERRAGRDASGRDLPPDSSFSRSVLERVRLEARPVVVTGTDRGDDLSTSRSISAQGLKSILAAPLYERNQLRGVLYADSRLAKGMFASADAEIVMALGSHISIALEHARAGRVEMERRALEQDLALSAAVQQLLLPARTVISEDGIEVVGYNVSASRCGGDWWWHERLDGGVHRILLGDVTGHGAGAAMVTAALAAGYRTMARLGVPGDVGAVLGELDALLRGICRDSYHMTFVALELDPAQRSLRFWSAGAPPFMLCTKDGDVQTSGAGGTPLGVGRHQLATGSVTLAAGSRLVLFSDGLPESPVHGKERGFGLRRIRDVVREHAHASAGTLRDALAERMQRERGPLPADDDVTFIILDLEG